MISISIVKTELLIVSLLKYRVMQMQMCHNTMQREPWKLFFQIILPEIYSPR